jgi:hypothetical protein
MLLEEGVAPKDIGVIAPYNAQVTTHTRAWLQVQLLHALFASKCIAPAQSSVSARTLIEISSVLSKAERKRCYHLDSTRFSISIASPDAGHRVQYGAQ